MQAKNKPKVLLVLKIPPPLTGATQMNLYVLQNPLIREIYNIQALEIHYSRNYIELGKFSIRKFFSLFYYWFVLFKKLLFFKPELVYFQVSPFGSAFYRDLLLIITIKLFRKKILLHLHGKGIKNRINRSKLNRYVYYAAFNNTRVICLSDLVATDINAIYPNKPFIVPNGIPITIHEIPIKNHNQKPTILYISNLKKSKGLLELLNALKIIHETGFDFKACIVGNESREINADQLNKHITAMGLDKKLTYKGPLYGKEKTEMYLSSDLFVYPTLNDSWGLVILEAMEAGLPVVAYKEGSIPLIVEHRKTGILVEKGNILDLSKQIEFLLRHPEICKIMGNFGRLKFLQEYTLEKFEKKILSAFNSIFENEKERNP